MKTVQQAQADVSLRLRLYSEFRRIVRTESRVLQVPVYHDWMHGTLETRLPFRSQGGLLIRSCVLASPAALFGGCPHALARGRGKNEDKGSSGKCQRTVLTDLERANIYIIWINYT